MSVQQTKATGKAEKFQLKLGVNVCLCLYECASVCVCMRVGLLLCTKDSPSSSSSLLCEPESHQTQELWPTMPARATCILQLSAELNCPPFPSLFSFLQCQFNPCFPGVKCVNTAPGYRCEPCPLGFTGTPVEGVGALFAQTNKQVIDIE